MPGRAACRRVSSDATGVPPAMRMFAVSRAYLMRQRSSRSTLSALPGVVSAEPPALALPAVPLLSASMGMARKRVDV